MLIIILSLLCGLTALSIDMNLPAYSSLQNFFHADESHVQLTLSIFLIGYSIGQMICGPLSDHYGRRPVLLWGLVIFTLTGLACAVSQSLHWLIGFRLVQGAAASVGAVLSRAIIRDLYKKEQIAAALSQLTQVVMIAPMLAPIIGGVILEHLGWRAIFFTLAALGVIAWLATFYKIPESLKTKDEKSGEILHVLHIFVKVFTNKITFSYIAANCFIYSAMFCYVSMSPFIYMDVYGVSKSLFGFYMAVPVLFLIVGATTNGFLLKKFKSEKLLQVGIYLVIIAGFTLCALVLLKVPSVLAVMLPMCLYMFALGITSPNLTAAAIAPYPQHAGIASSLIGGFQTFSAAIASSVATYYYSHSAVSLALAVGILSVGSAVLSFSVHHRRMVAL